MRALVLTNDFPPRAGGIQTYVHSLLARLPPDEVVVYAPAWTGASEFDARQPFPVVRHPTALMLPVPSVLRRARAIAHAEGCDGLWFGAAAPLALLAQPLRRAGVGRVVASTHGHEAGWAMLPAARQLLRRIGRDVDALTYLGDYTKTRLAGALGPYAERLVHLPPGVDTDVFRPGLDPAPVRERYGLGERPVVVCISRLVARKGQDTLIRALPAVRRKVPEAALLLVGEGPYRHRLERLADECGVRAHVVFAGRARGVELPAHYAAGDVYAMPCRTRRGGLDVEGLGIVFLEASACGLPVVVGRSGGAPAAVRDGETGFVVDGRRVEEVAERISGLLCDGGLRRSMGEKGRAWMQAEWRLDLLAARLRALLADASPRDGC
jgi:phosphatidylinositol alpha-1,6-mannosyltransferase